MVRLRGASGESDRRHTCNQVPGTRPAFFHRYFSLPPYLVILPKHRENTGNSVCSSCKFPDSKGKGYCDNCRKNFQFFSRSCIGLPTQVCVCYRHKVCKLAQGKFAVGQGKHREFENTI